MNANRGNQTSLGYKIAAGIFVVVAIFVIGYVIYNLYNNYESNEDNSPWLVKNTKLANYTTVIPAYQIKAPNDGRYGLEFTYAGWIYIDNWTYKNGEYKNVLVKGDPNGELLQAPGIWIGKNTNELIINMNTFAEVKETVVIGNIPLNKWFHFVIVLMNNNIDVFINGELKTRKRLSGVPKLNYNDCYINSSNGFSGMVSRLKYFNYAIPYYLIERMFNAGPSKQAADKEETEDTDYLARDWWMRSGMPRSKD